MSIRTGFLPSEGQTVASDYFLFPASSVGKMDDEEIDVGKEFGDVGESLTETSVGCFSV